MLAPKDGDEIKGLLDILPGALKALKENIAGILSVSQQLNTSAIEIAKSFGQGNENVQNITQSIVKARNSVIDLGFDWQDIAGVQKNISQQLNTNLLISSEYYKDILATQKVTNQDSGVLALNFKNAGISLYDMSSEMYKVVKSARDLGVSVYAVSSQVLSNMSAINKFNFEGGVEGLSKMAAQAVQLRIQMKTTLDMSEKLLNPEEAIKMSAALQRLGVTTSELLDPLRLMDLSMNNPEELQNQLVELSRQFVTLNEKGKFEILPGEKFRIREIAQSLNMTTDEFMKMGIAAAEMDDKMKRISLPDFFTQEQKNVIMSMAEMKEGEYKLTIGGEAFGMDEAVERLKRDKETMDRFMEMAEPKTMEQLAREQRDYLQIISDNIAKGMVQAPYYIAGSNAEQDLMKMAVGLTDKVRELFKLPSIQVKNVQQLLDGTYEGLGKVLKIFTSGNLKNVEDVFNFFTDFKMKSLKNFSELGKEFKSTEIYHFFENVFKDLMSKNMSIPKYETPSIHVVPKEIKPIVPTQTGVTPQPFEMNNRDYMASLKGISTNQEKEKTISEMSVGGEVSVNLNINITAPTMVNTEQIKQVLATTEIAQMLSKTISTEIYNRDVPDTNPQRRLNTFRNQLYTG